MIVTRCNAPLQVATRRRLAVLGMLVVLATASGCSRTGNEPGEGGVTVSEQKQLDAIAARLDARADQIAPDTRIEVQQADRVAP